METILEAIVEIIIHYMFSYPGAFVRWAFTGFRKGKFKIFVGQDIFLNSFCFILFISGIVVLFTYYIPFYYR